MGDIVLLPLPPAGGRPRGDRLRQTGELVAFPLVVTRRGWLIREGLRLAAGVHTASVANVVRFLEHDTRSAGLPPTEARRQIEEALVLALAARDAALTAVGRAPGWAGPVGGAA